ncbi:3'-5' exoribonuclease HELZ2 isoform X1 [Paramisgurnus dabryanus]|uniref:3'-5' exoribonuclease HELZ2 isoform X1 n=1 Tax=Paramisgurnus dabryanus TaxID=90735 RepID=UPI0031F33732
MSTMQLKDAQLQQFMQVYALRTACNECTRKHSYISYSILSVPHRCSQNLMLVKAKAKGHRWSPVSCRPSYPRPRRYEVCWFFKEEVGCTVHRDKCTFARSTEEAAVWNLEKQTSLDHKSLIHLINQREKVNEHSRREDVKSSSQSLSLYQEKLLEEFRRSSNEILIISEQVDDVCVSHDQSLIVDCLQTDGEITWRFKITTERSLVHVALLKVESGAIFSLGDNLNTFPPITHTPGHHLRSSQSTYELSVCFLSFRPGVYEQWLVFDFDMRPVLLRKIKVRVGEQFHVQQDEEENKCAENVSNERWDRGNRVIVPFYTTSRGVDELLLSKYKPPQMNLHFSSYTDHSLPLRQDNYRERAHDFLFREEIAEEKLISRLNVCGSASLSELNVSQFSISRRLCATLKVSCILTPDTPEGLMLKRGVQMALVNSIATYTSAPAKHANRVYEALVLKPAANEGHISLELSAKSVSELQLKKDSRCEMEVQFQLSRLWFCQMHQAIDHLPDLHNVLPDLNNCCVPVNTTRQSEMNNKQQIALNFILGKCEGSKAAAPLLIYGPFGTGKTLCLASAAIQLAHQPKTKVLICTYTNSSADLYVSVHFHPYITKGHPNLKILRIKANKGGASITATDDITRKYCLCSPDGQSFIFPTQSDLESQRIIITTTTMARRFLDLKLPKGFFSHILIDEASQMLESEALMALGLADKHTRVVLAGDHMQMAPKLFSVSNNKHSEHTLLNRLFRYYQDHSSNIGKKSRIIFNENYRSTAEIVDFVSTHFYVSDGIKAKGDVPRHPKLYPMMFHHVRGECHLDSISMSWYNRAEVNSVINVIQDLMTDWPEEWGKREPMQICVLSEGRQVEIIRSSLRWKGIHGISVQNLANIQGKQYRVIIITTVHTRDRLFQSESSCLDFFDDIKALNTAITRAQSLVVVVGDASALCCFGNCSRIWKSYIEHCISKGSAKPGYLTRDILEHEVSEILKFKKTERVAKTEDGVPTQPETDLILKEMIDDYDRDTDSDEDNEGHPEQKRLLFSSSEKEDLLKLVRERPGIYRHGELVMEGYNLGYVVPYDNPTEHIAIKGRKNFGMSFPGDEVVVETGYHHEEGNLTGKVLGVTNSASFSSKFVCTLENENYQRRRKTDTNNFSKIMIPLSRNTTKIRVMVSKKSHNFIPIWKLERGKWKILRYFPLNEDTKKRYVFVVQIFTWKAHCSFPLGSVTEVLPIGTTLEEGLEILKTEFQLTPLPLMQEAALFTTQNDETDYSMRSDLTGLKMFTVDPEGARDLDDAISVKNLGSCYEIGVHVADVASFVTEGSPLDSAAKERGATFYSPGTKPVFMFPEGLTTNLFSLLPDKKRKVISFIVTVDKESGFIREKTFDLSVVTSKKKFTYEEAEEIISQYDERLKFDTLEDCVRVAYHFARKQRKDRLKESWAYAQPDQHRNPGEREAHLMIEELNIMFNHAMADFLTKNATTKSYTPLRCQLPPTAEQLEKINDRHKEVIPLSSYLTYHIDKNRMDLRNTFTFTVHSPDPNPHLRDAISVSDSEYHYEIGFHKAESNTWSLTPGKNCRAISLILKVENMTGKIVEQKLALSFVNSNRLLSITEANSIIDQFAEHDRSFDSLEGCVLVAYHFALDHRRRRPFRDVDNSNPPNSKCRLMMDEVNLMFKSACEHLTGQITPSSNIFDCTVTASPELEQRIKRDDEEFLQALEEHLDLNHEPNGGNFIILTSMWEKIESAALTCDFYKMADLISADDIHPQLLPAVVQLRASFGKALFIRSFSCEKALVGHYSLHLDSYTHASSPIRRYIDLILQRLMHAALTDGPLEYSEKDIELLCDKCERGENRAKQFERKAESLCLAVNLQKQSTYKLAFVTVVRPDSESFKLSFPFDKGTYPDRLPVMYRDLQLEDQPIFERQQKQMRLTWKKRMYSMNTTNILKRKLRFCSEIQQSTWHDIVEAVKVENWEEAKSLILAAEVTEYQERDDVSDNSSLDSDHTFTSEEDHYTNFNLCLKAGDTVQVQLTSENERGYWAPAVQLLNVRSNFEICVEHTRSPIKCFSKHANRPSKPSYHNEEDYVQIWKPLCEMESAATAVDDSDCVVIEKMHIDWTQSMFGETKSLSGTFSLPVENIKKWAIEFDLAKCFLCIRKRVSKPNSLASQLDPEYFTWVAHGVTFQCLDEPHTLHTENKSKIIHFDIKYASMNLPKDKRDDTYTVEVIPKLLPDIRKESAVNNLPAANELVRNIATGHRIRKDGFGPAIYLERYVLRRQTAPKGLPELNESQYNALEQAVNGKFTLIQGPPGTGKTVVGAYIVYWFSYLNSKKPQNQKGINDEEKKEVILYCGPSNKSVDVIAEYLLKFGENLKQLRVCSRQMEMNEFPYPGSTLQISQKSLRQERSKPELRDITLHHRIRMSHNPYAQPILDFDERIRKQKESENDQHSLTDAEIEEYKKLLNTARLYELKRHDVILCTCTTAASPNLTKSLSAQQILIDESAMATEPQTLVPLVSFKPEKVVLLGDHKQLRPIVKNEHVRRLGMTRSLFERYMGRALMLDTQYRMQEDICKFPSEAYYQDKLKTQVDKRTSMLHAETETMRQSKHILFGDIRGEEISLVVSTARGNENSKANLAEVKKAVEICTQLISAGSVRPEDIAILSPYNAQVALIKEKFKERHRPEKITVTTITKSQGSEWRYVILSMVRSCPSEEIEPMPSREWLSKHIGFVGDENQINVGITRAQEGLCILGNQELLNCSPAWRKLLKHYSGCGSVVRADQIIVRNVR